MIEVTWKPFDYDDKKTAPPVDKLVWVVEELYHGMATATLGFFDGSVMYVWSDDSKTMSDDCYITWWAEMERPEKPADTTKVETKVVEEVRESRAVDGKQRW